MNPIQIYKLTPTQYNRLENLRQIYEASHHGAQAKAQISCYLRGLTDAGAITEKDFKELLDHYTL